MAEMDALIALGAGALVVMAYIVEHKLKRGKLKISAAIRRAALMLGRGFGTIFIKMLPNVSGAVVWVAKKS